MAIKKYWNVCWKRDKDGVKQISLAKFSEQCVAAAHMKRLMEIDTVKGQWMTTYWLEECVLHEPDKPEPILELTDESIGFEIEL